MTDKINIIDQYWKQWTGRVWHNLPRFNLVGEHVTIIKVGRHKVKEAFCIRNHNVTITLKFTNGKYFNFPVFNNSMYWQCNYQQIGGIVTVKVDLSWYCLTYYYDLIGRQIKQ